MRINIEKNRRLDRWDVLEDGRIVASFDTESQALADADDRQYREACWQEALAEHDAAARRAGLI